MSSHPIPSSPLSSQAGNFCVASELSSSHPREAPSFLCPCPCPYSVYHLIPIQIQIHIRIRVPDPLSQTPRPPDLENPKSRRSRCYLFHPFPFHSPTQHLTSHYSLYFHSPPCSTFSQKQKYTVCNTRDFSVLIERKATRLLRGFSPGWGSGWGCLVPLFAGGGATMPTPYPPLRRMEWN